jgi:50S ribosomal protein L16 3-hydroxylase
MNDEAFWNEFLETSWERHPAHLGTAVEPLLTPEELFGLAVDVAESVGGGNARIKIPWCDDGRKIRALEPNRTSAEVLPQRRDRNLDGYRQRMSGFETFFFQIPTLHLFDSVLWSRIVRFCRKLYPKTGVPGHMAWTDAYFGRYASTPFGVHVDGASNFTFGVDGYKSLYLWEPDYYHAHMARAGVHGYREFIADATKLTVGPGEVIYWPSRFYHVAIPDNRFSVTMNFAFYPELDHRSWLERAFMAMTSGTSSKQTPFHGLKLPDGLAAACASAERALSTGAFERQMLRELVAHCTRFGFHEAPPLRRPSALEPGARVRQTADISLVCVPDGHGSSILSANGHVLDVPESDGVGALVGALNSGQRIDVDSVTLGIFEQLYAWGAVERC